MIGYFEKESLLNGIQKIINSCITNKTPPMDALNKVVDCIMFFPTVDVVPKSECKKCGQKTVEAILNLQENIATAKSEVAREIFEEIYHILLTSFPTSSFIDAPCTTENRIYDMIAKLKKKYGVVE